MDTIVIESEFHRPEVLLKELQARPITAAGSSSAPSEDGVDARPGVRFELRQQPASAVRIEPVITVALITGGATVLAAVIAALAPLVRDAAKDTPRKIVVYCVDGTKVDVPANMPPEQVEKVLKNTCAGAAKRILITEQTPAA
jgi:hypothetical protein